MKAEYLYGMEKSEEGSSFATTRHWVASYHFHSKQLVLLRLLVFSPTADLKRYGRPSSHRVLANIG